MLLARRLDDVGELWHREQRLSRFEIRACRAGANPVYIGRLAESHACLQLDTQQLQLLYARALPFHRQPGELRLANELLPMSVLRRGPSSASAATLRRSVSRPVGLVVVALVLAGSLSYGAVRAGAAVLCTAPAGHSSGNLAAQLGAGSGHIELSLDVSCPPFSDVVSLDAQVDVEADSPVTEIAIRSRAPDDQRVLLIVWRGQKEAHGRVFSGRVLTFGNNELRDRICASGASVDVALAGDPATHLVGDLERLSAKC